MTGKKELIQKLRKEEIIFRNGDIDPYKLEEKYGKQEAKEILNNITIKDVYNTYMVGELFDVAYDELCDASDLLEGYERPIAQVRRVLMMLEVLYEKRRGWSEFYE